MAKLVIFTFAFALLGTGYAAALDAAWGVGPNEQSSLPYPRHQVAPSVDSTVVTQSINGSYGFPSRVRQATGFSAANGFGPSDENDEPVPRFQIAR